MGGLGGWSLCRVARFWGEWSGVNAGLVLSAVVVCESRIFSLSLLATVRGGTSFLCPKRQRNEAKKALLNHATLSVHSVQFLFIGAPKARCSPERRMCEPLLLANPDTNTLRPVRSRASTLAKEPPRPHASFRFRFLVRWLRGLNSCFRRQRHLAYWYFRIGTSFLGGLTAWTTRLFSPTTGSRIFAVLFPEELARWFEARAHLVVGRPRIARGAPWAGSITGGEACGYPCSEKEGLTHPPLWRAPCFWGTYE